jgi:hypothetical protein
VRFRLIVGVCMEIFSSQFADFAQGLCQEVSRENYQGSREVVLGWRRVSTS